MTMELHHEDRGSTGVLRIDGRLDMVGAPAVRTRISELVSSGATCVVIDFGGTTFIDSTGLGAVVAGLKSARQAGGDLRLANVGGQVDVILGLTNLDRVFRRFPTVDDAVDAHT